MEYRDFLPAVLLLTLMAPPEAKASANGVEAPPRGAVAGQAAARRRGAGTAASEATVEPEVVAGAGEYLRRRAEGGEPDEVSRQAWERFYPACDGAIRRFAGSFRSRGVDVDDCAQEVWADLLRRLPGFRLDASRGRFTSWLYSVVRSKASDQLRRRGRHAGESLSAVAEEDLAAAGDGPAERIERESEREALGRALAVLRERSSERNYQVLHRRQIEGQGVKQVAEALGMKPAQVWVTEHRMKRRLGEILGG